MWVSLYQEIVLSIFHKLLRVKQKLLHLSSSIKCLPCSCGAWWKGSQFKNVSVLYLSGNHYCHVTEISYLIDLFRFKEVQAKTCFKVEHVRPHQSKNNKLVNYSPELNKTSNTVDREKSWKWEVQCRRVFLTDSVRLLCHFIPVLLFNSFVAKQNELLWQWENGVSRNLRRRKWPR